MDLCELYYAEPTEARIAKSCEIRALLRYYAVYSDNFTSIFSDKISVTSSRVRKSTREYSLTEVS
jgi:hypothetical protein